MTLSELIDRYWQLAYAEGRQSRQHDTEGGDAQDCRTSIDEGIMALLSRIEELEGLLEPDRSERALQNTDALFNVAAAEAKLAEAVKVIEPFATTAEEYGPSQEDTWLDWKPFEIGKFRAARSFLQSLSKPGGSYD